ncbi:MAG: ABC transporter ATP-binding protein [Myxococcaceae bacterium]|nr:ABC transporter ATP-binding protein [Myxococcaceae bacterium]
MTAAIAMRGVTKHFRKYRVKREYTTLKTELVRLLTGKRPPDAAPEWIEVLNGVDLEVPKGRTLGVIGRNGSGKSTLLKLMTGIYSPTAGEIRVEGRVSALLELGAGFHPDFTGRENININGGIVGMSRAEMKERVPQIIEFAELGDFIDEPVRTYSSGMFMRLAFAVATHVNPEILIIDEILSVGDDHFQRKSLAKMTEFKRSGRTIVLVTHDLGTVERWCDQAVWIDAGRVREVGPSAEVVAQYRRAVAEAEAQSERTGSSALSAPGLALPELPKEAPPAKVASLTRVRLLGVDGAEAAQLAGDARLDVELAFQADRPDTALACTVAVVSDKGEALFSTTLEAGTPGAGECRARLSIPRLGLGPGQYAVQASVHAHQGQPSDVVSQALTVSDTAPGHGVLRPPHVWSLEAAPGAARASP